MKRFTIILFCVFFFINLFSNQEISPIITKADISENDAMWDLLLQFDVDTPTGQTGLAGMEWDGTYFYASKWSDSDQLFKFDADGNFIEPITVPLVGCRDMAFDGSYMYGSPASSQVSCWESETGNAVTANFINVAGQSVRALAYDEVTDTFWSGNWSDNIVNWDRNGTILESYPWIGSLYGLAFDESLIGPYLYAHSQDPGCVVYQLNPNNNLEQLDIFDATSYGAAGAIAGGACVMTDCCMPYVTLGLLLQGSPDYIIVLEVGYIIYPPSCPGEPQNVEIFPDLTGFLQAEINWICPEVDVNGEPLTELLEMRVYRNNELIYTDFDPVIGGPGNYLDNTVPDNGMFEYRIIGYNSWGEGLPYTESVWVGEDVPAAVEELTLTTNPPNLVGILNWVNPTTGLHGGAFNEPILGYHIIRNDGVYFELTGIHTEWIDYTIPYPGYYSYTVQTYNIVGDGGIAETTFWPWPAILILEDFSSGNFPPDGWTTNNSTNWILSNTNFAGGTVPEADLYWSPSVTGVHDLISYPIDTTNYDFLYLTFLHYLDPYATNPNYERYIHTTSNGTDWHIALCLDQIENTAINEELIICNEDVGSENFQVAWAFDGDSWDLNNWFIDDILLIPYYTEESGYVEGNVTLNGGNGHLWKVKLSSGLFITYLSDEDNYSFKLPEGIWDITASLEDYESVTIENVEVVAGSVISNIDFVLNYIGVEAEKIVEIVKQGITSIYPNPFNPATKISFNVPQNSDFATIEIYNLKGQKIKTFAFPNGSLGTSGITQSPNQQIVWNGKDENNKPVASGIYFCKFQSGNVIQTRKMLLLK